MGKQVLIVDDEIDVLDILAEIVEELGLQTCRALGGRRALDLLRSEIQVDLVVTDLHMPQVSGMDVLHAARARQTTLPVIFITGSAPALLYSVQDANGHVAVLPKPCSIDELQKAIRALIE